MNNYDLTTKKEMICVKHKKHCATGGWRLTEWETNEGILYGWGCDNSVRYPEFTTQKIRNERVEYANDMLQSHRAGELSREFIEAHPKRAKKMLKDGAITKDEVKSAKYVWNKDVKGVTKKIDAEALIA